MPSTKPLKDFLFGYVLLHFLRNTNGNCIATNVALRKPTDQSTTYQDSNGGPSRNAVDGSNSGNYYDLTCTHTSTQYQPFWRVNLQDIYLIDHIYLINRHDCCQSRLSHVEITVSTQITFLEPKRFAYHGSAVGNFVTVFPDDGPMLARWVRIRLMKTDVLTLCEVKVMTKESLREMSFAPGLGGHGREMHIKTVPLQRMMQAIENCIRCETNFPITIFQSEQNMQYTCRHA